MLLVIGVVAVTFSLWGKRKEKSETGPRPAASNNQEFITVYVGDGQTGDRNSPPKEEQELTSFLTEQDARYLQDVEHYGGFVLGDLAFPLVAKALRSAQIESLTSFFIRNLKAASFTTTTEK